MFLHIGADYLIKISEIIAIISPDAGDNKNFLIQADKKSKIVDITTSNKQSWIITGEKIYRSPVSPQALRNRLIGHDTIDIQEM